MSILVLNLPPVKWEVSQQVEIPQIVTKLGDGYSMNTSPPNSSRTTYSVNIPGLNGTMKNQIAGTLKSYQGVTKFRWRPIEALPYKVFICDRFSVINKGENVWEINANFIEQK